MKAKITIFILLLTLFSVEGFSQRTGRYDYGQEFIWGISKNTTGGLIGGVVLRKSRKIAENQFESIGIELMNVKHHKEVRWNSIRTGNLFIFGKLNYLYTVRAQYGREFILFHKAPVQGVEIKLNLAAGPSLGFLTPYYVDIYVDQSLTRFNVYSIPYNTGIAYSEITGPGNIFEGLSDAQLRIGANVKASVSFEIGTIKSQVTGFEVGGLLDAYAGDITLMANTSNRSVFPTAFITLFYGSRK